MDTKLFEEYKLSLYEEVYRTDRPGQSVVINTLDETLYMKKELTVYNTGVYEWIMQHPDPRLAAVREYFPGEDCLIVIEEYISGNTLSAGEGHHRFSYHRCVYGSSGYADSRRCRPDV